MMVGALMTLGGDPRDARQRPVRRSGVDGGRAVRFPGLGQQPADAAERFLPEYGGRLGVRPGRRRRGDGEHRSSRGAPARSWTRSATRRCSWWPACWARSDSIVTLSLAGRIHTWQIVRTEQPHDEFDRSLAVLLFASLIAASCSGAGDDPDASSELLAHQVALKPELVGVHPRVFVTSAGLDALRQRARTTHRAEWSKVICESRRVEGRAAAGAGSAGAAVAERRRVRDRRSRPRLRRRAEARVSGGGEGVDARGDRLRTVGLHLQQTEHRSGRRPSAVRDRLGVRPAATTTSPRPSARASGSRSNVTPPSSTTRLRRGPDEKLNFTQNHDFIPTAGLAVTALALMGESKDAERWAVARARAPSSRRPAAEPRRLLLRRLRVLDLLVALAGALSRRLGACHRREPVGPRRVPQLEDLPRARAAARRPERLRLRRHLGRRADARRRRAPNTRASIPAARCRAISTSCTASPRVLQDPQAQAVAERYASFGHSNLEEFWTLLWRDPSLKAGADRRRCRSPHHFEDSGVVYMRTSWAKDATAIAFKAGPPEGHRVAALLPHASGVAARQRPCASGRRQLHRVGARPLPHRRHRLRRPALGAQPQHADVCRRGSRDRDAA